MKIAIYFLITVLIIVIGSGDTATQHGHFGAGSYGLSGGFGSSGHSGGYKGGYSGGYGGFGRGRYGGFERGISNFHHHLRSHHGVYHPYGGIQRP